MIRRRFLQSVCALLASKRLPAASPAHIAWPYRFLVDLDGISIVPGSITWVGIEYDKRLAEVFIVDGDVT